LRGVQTIEPSIESFYSSNSLDNASAAEMIVVSINTT
jgi:hypothetical protein